jgi:hypothetical protein
MGFLNDYSFIGFSECMKQITFKLYEENQYFISFFPTQNRTTAQVS